MIEREYWTGEQVAAECGVSRSRIRQIALKLGIGTMVMNTKVFYRNEIDLIKSRRRKG